MNLEIDNHSGVAVYRQIMEQIHDLILSGRLKGGDQLMAVRELAQQIKVNPMTVSKAYAYLEKEGLLERRRGVGLYIMALPPNKVKKQQRERIAQSMREVAILSKKMGLSEKEACDEFRAHFKKIDL